MRKRFLAALLALVMVMALAVPAFAAEDITETVDDEFIHLTVTGAFKKVKAIIGEGEKKKVIFVVPDSGKCTVTGNIKENDIWSGEHPDAFSFGDVLIWNPEENYFDGEDMGIEQNDYEASTANFSAYNEAENKNKIYGFYIFGGGVYVTYETTYNELVAWGVLRDVEELQQPVQPTQPAGAGTYTAKQWDTWGQLALNNYGTCSRAVWTALKAANGNKEIKADMVVTLPETVGKYTRLAPQVLAEGEKLYTVKAGDTLGQIALAAYGDMSQYKAIFERNSDRLTSPTMIYEGQTLVLPVKPAAEKPAGTEKPAEAEQPAGFAKGDKVTVKEGAKTYTGGSLADFVYKNTYTVISVKGDRVVIGVNGVATAAMNAADLISAK